MSMECGTAGISDTKKKSSEEPAQKDPTCEPKSEEIVISMEVEKENELNENDDEESENEFLGGNKDVEDILGTIGRYLYRKRNNQGKTKNMFPPRRIRRNSRNRARTKRYRSVSDEIGRPKKRNWNKLSIYPFINFIRVFRKAVPKKCPPDTMATTANYIWKLMCEEEKLPFYKKAERALLNGYKD